MTETTPAQTAQVTTRDRLVQNHQLLIECGQFRAERNKVIEAVEKAPMMKKAALVTQAVHYSFEVESRLLQALQNLCALAAAELLEPQTPAQTEPQTDPVTDGETEQTEPETVPDGETIH